MESIQTKRAVVLQDTVQYYSKDPDGRRCIVDDMCRYSPKTLGKEATSEGCAIGRLLPPELREELDINYYNKTVRYTSLFWELPQEVQDLGQDFLTMLQNLHDVDIYWDSEGLTEKGEEMVKQIQEVYCTTYHTAMKQPKE